MVVEPTLHRDHRGYFVEIWNRREFAAAGLEADFVQSNQSCSVQNTLRGLHYQIRRPQAKLVGAAAGAVFDVVVDLRRESPAFGKWFGLTLSEENRRQLFLPAGCAHGFLALSQRALVTYQCSRFYDPADEGGLLWSDPDLAIDWPLAPGKVPILSEKDGAWSGFAAFCTGLPKPC